MQPNVVRFILPIDPPDIRGRMDARQIDARVTDAVRDVHVAVADFAIAVQHAPSAEACLTLHQRIDGLLLALGAVADAALIKADDLMPGAIS